jgi:hypothetical protein
MAMAACALTCAAPAAAQVAPQPPGPWVIDLRGATIGVPQAAAFYPPLTEETLVPARAFGIEAGAHVYFWTLGPGRLGAGASVIQARATADPVSMTARVLAPQVSINFGTSEGWSYISGGVGLASLTGRLHPPQEPGSRDSGTLPAFNLGAGARWFFTRHVAIGFDLRMHRIGAASPPGGGVGTPAAFLGSAAVGFSLK